MFLPGTRAQVLYSSAVGKSLSPRSGSEGFICCRHAGPFTLPIPMSIQKELSGCSLVAFPEVVYFYKYGNQKKERIEPRIFVSLLPVTIHFPKTPGLLTKRFMECLEDGTILKFKDLEYKIRRTIGTIDAFGLLMPMNHAPASRLTPKQLECFVLSAVRKPGFAVSILGVGKGQRDRLLKTCRANDSELVRAIFYSATKKTFRYEMNKMIDDLAAGRFNKSFHIIQQILTTSNSHDIRRNKSNKAVPFEVMLSNLFTGAANSPKILLERSHGLTSSRETLARVAFETLTEITSLNK